jgi:hypothetical protein
VNPLESSAKAFNQGGFCLALRAENICPFFIFCLFLSAQTCWEIPSWFRPLAKIRVFCIVPPESESVPSKQAEGVKMRKTAIALVVVAALAAGATALHSQDQWKQRGAR